MTMTQADREALARNIAQITKNAALVTTAFPSIIMRVDLTDTEAVQFKAVYPEWSELVGTELKQGWIIAHEGELYRIGQTHTAQSQWVPGETGTDALYSHISINEDGYEVWKEWDGVSGLYDQDQIVHDPFDGDNLYKSKIPNNVWGPPSQQPNYWEKV